VHLEARPGSLAGVDGRIDVLAGEVGQAIVHDQPHRDLGLGELEGAEPRRQPVGGERVERADGEDTAGLLLDRSERVAQHVECLADRDRQALARAGQLDPAGQPQEQGRADPLLEELDLVADRGPGGAQLLGGPGEAPEPGRRLEGADRGERRQAKRHPA
jgi:hypothetical protein